MGLKEERFKGPPPGKRGNIRAMEINKVRIRSLREMVVFN